jgi:hypothetical protein
VLEQAELDMQSAYERLEKAQDRAAEIARRAKWALESYRRSRSQKRLLAWHEQDALHVAAIKECSQLHKAWDIACGAVQRAEWALAAAEMERASPRFAL